MAAALTALGLLALLGGLAYAIFALHPFGHDVLLAAGVGALLVGLIVGPRLRARRQGAALARRSHLGRVFGGARGLFVLLLACWLGLLGWSRVSPGGPPPEPKADPTSIRLVTWNLHHGRTGGPLWKRFDWDGRKRGLATAMGTAAPDILCVQEAVAEQVRFLEQILPDHRRVGVGRDDGAAGGEHCAIYFDARRFEHLANDTFWLEEPTDRPAMRSSFNPRRICTWVRLRDRATGRTLRVYNTHLYLTESARVSAAQVIVRHLTAGDPTDAIILAGDFNAPPTAPTWRVFTDAGLADSALLAGRPAGTPTYHFHGVRLRCLDGILVNAGWQVRGHRVLDVKPGGTFPSDHFGILADLALR
ncbi:MAG: endonuclease/exonuclease/phosphatase family protein [Gemmataceae bacterium]|nr:endonuclease/exonuclease/phosphatase family protein [Gemmataceae bacterium]